MKTRDEGSSKYFFAILLPDCGLNFIKPDNIQNASRFSTEEDDVFGKNLILSILFRIVGGVEAVPDHVAPACFPDESQNLEQT